jgi:hypothetical protein
MNKIGILLLLIFSACQGEQFSKEECEGLSMKHFRGIPLESSKFKSGCKHHKDLHYTQERCSTAFSEFVITGLESDLKKQYGDRIMECFNDRDIEKWKKKPRS